MTYKKYINFSSQSLIRLIMPMHINDRIKILLDKRDWSQRQLALASGVSPEYINRIMNGTAKNVSPRIAEKLSKALEVPAKFLQYGVEGRVPELEVFAQMPMRDSLTEKGKMLFQQLPTDKKKHVITIMEDIFGNLEPPEAEENDYEMEQLPKASNDVKKKGFQRRSDR